MEADLVVSEIRFGFVVRRLSKDFAVRRADLVEDVERFANSVVADGDAGGIGYGGSSCRPVSS
jgi:hypothetical protein